MKRSLSLLTLALMAGVAASSAQAATLLALTGDRTVHVVDADSRKVTKTFQIEGLTAPLAGFDVRPADGMLYGLQNDGKIVTIDMTSGRATMKSQLDQPLPAGATLIVDFNPAADRLRVVGSDGVNLRINVDDGKTTVDGRLRFADGDANKGATPAIMAGAYTNKMKGAKETALYEIDMTTGSLVRQAPPNDGILNTLGKVEGAMRIAAFNIVPDGQGGNMGWVLAGGALSMLDLASGKLKPAGQVTGLSGTPRDLAVAPRM